MGHALVTGCSSGIGLAIAKTLLREGWTVTGLSRRRPEFGTDEVDRGGPAAGMETFRWLPTDLFEIDALPNVLADIYGVDAIIHAAGIQTTAFLGDLRPDDFRRMLALHVEAPMQIVNMLAERISTGGRVVLIGSRTMVGVAGKSQYAASKSALPGLCRSLAIEFAPRRVTCNVVAPGPTDTPMLRDPGRSSVPPKVPALGKLLSCTSLGDCVGLSIVCAGERGVDVAGGALTGH